MNRLDPNISADDWDELNFPGPNSTISTMSSTVPFPPAGSLVAFWPSGRVPPSWGPRCWRAPRPWPKREDNALIG